VPTRSHIPRPAARRLSLYLRECESLLTQGVPTASSESLGARLGLSAAQVRRDLAYVAQAGQRGVGYDMATLVTVLQEGFGLERPWRAVLVGVGNIGRALLSYAPFRESRVAIVAAVDCDPATIGSQWGGRTVESMQSLGEVVRRGGIELGVIAVPASAAQLAADDLVAAGVRGILNFAPVQVTVPEGTACSHVDVSVELRCLAMEVALGGEHRPRRGRVGARSR